MIITLLLMPGVYGRELSVECNKEKYSQGDIVKVEATLNITPMPPPGVKVTFQIKHVATATTLLVEVNETGSNGIAAITFMLPENTNLGTFVVIATVVINNTTLATNTTFEVVPESTTVSSTKVCLCILILLCMTAPAGIIGYMLTEEGRFQRIRVKLLVCKKKG